MIRMGFGVPGRQVLAATDGMPKLPHEYSARSPGACCGDIELRGFRLGGLCGRWRWLFDQGHGLAPQGHFWKRNGSKTCPMTRHGVGVFATLMHGGRVDDQPLRRGSKASALPRSIASRSLSDICVCRNSSIIAAALTKG